MFDQIKYYLYENLKIHTMKNLILIITLAGLLTACETDKIFKTDPLAMIHITEQQSGVVKSSTAKIKSNPEHLSGIEIVRQTKEICLVLNNTVTGDGSNEASRYFHENQRDTTSTPPKLLMFATDVITEYGTLSEELLTCTDVVLARWLNEKGLRDTIAYIPNATIRDAAVAIRRAFSDNDSDECYRLFNEAYTFIPITGAEWRELRSNGQN